MVTPCLSDRPWRSLRWLILAPHPDDETLGAGALIAQGAASGHFAALVYLTDGSGSHPPVDGRAGRLIAARRREAANALFRLTRSRRHCAYHLGWKDAAPAAPTSNAFLRTAAKLASLCQRLQVDVIAVTALHEPHCDHAAAARLAYAVRSCAKRRVIVAEYCVWAERPNTRQFRAVRSRAMPAGKRRHALRAHRSQLTASHGPGFRLAGERQRMPAYDTLFVRRSQ